jgi:serine/threonine protein phosphatase PrpC
MRSLRVATETAVGRREENQDSVLAQQLSGGGLLLAVADGMGGHAAGEVASSLALETLRAAIEAGEGLREAVLLANRRVNEKGQDPDLHGMGTTLTVVLLTNGEFLVANVGDSRCYALDGGGIRQLTEDHSFLAEAVRRGQPRELAMASQWKDALIRSIGASDEVEVDLFGPFLAEEDTILLLCSDGLYKALGDGELREIIRSAESVDAAAQALVSAAYEKGSDDNITAALAEIAADTTPVEEEGLDSGPEEAGLEGSGQVQEKKARGGAEQKEASVSPIAPMEDPAPGPRPLQVGPKEVGFGSRPPVVGGRPSKRGPSLPTVLKGLVLVILAVALYLVFG